MDPKKIYELIVANSDCKEEDNDFDISEILDEFTAVNIAMNELGNVVREIENRNRFSNDYAVINRKLKEKKNTQEFERVDASYER